ncbi:Cullin-associated NEDD8-dissociated protein 2, partial [Coemansia erecta]
IEDVDHDLRGMAVSDLLKHLRNLDKPLNKDDGERYAEALIGLLQDTQSYVQNLAMECLGQLITLISPNTSQAAIISICNRIQDAGKDAGNNALSVALRVVVSKISENGEQKGMLAHMATPVVNTLENSKDLSTDVMVDIFGALFEILASAGNHLAADPEAVAKVQTLLLKYISHKSIPVRRRAIEALGKFIVNAPGKRSEQALDTIFRRYQTSESDEDSGVLLRVLVTIIRQSSQRVESLVPVIIDTELKAVDEGEVECGRERRVVSLVAFETIIRYCLKYAQERRDEIYDVA